mmetsp:Transcript_93039/g.260153  ORF Transcript_93039/g.260153 Transcript_93039/m.260153 type:complete len:202 (-) Transcript_93039:122-727(-)
MGRPCGSRCTATGSPLRRTPSRPPTRRAYRLAGWTPWKAPRWTSAPQRRSAHESTTARSRRGTTTTWRSETRRASCPSLEVAPGRWASRWAPTAAGAASGSRTRWRRSRPRAAAWRCSRWSLRCTSTQRTISATTRSAREASRSSSGRASASRPSTSRTVRTNRRSRPSFWNPARSGKPRPCSGSQRRGREVKGFARWLRS